MNFLKLGVPMLLFFCVEAMAALTPYTWTDHYDPADIKLTAGGGSTLVYTFDISDGVDGFRPGVDRLIGGAAYVLTINLYDDGDGAAERVRIDMPGSSGDTTFRDLSGTEYGGYSYFGRVQLVDTGMLTMTITALAGDLYFGDAHLLVRGNRADDASLVPEPEGLALLGLGVVALGVGQRKRLWTSPRAN